MRGEGTMRCVQSTGGSLLKKRGAPVTSNLMHSTCISSPSGTMGWAGAHAARVRHKERAMGVSLSFLAIKGAAPADIHRALGVTDTGVVSPEFEYPRPPVRGAMLPDGWYLVLLKEV